MVSRSGDRFNCGLCEDGTRPATEVVRYAVEPRPNDLLREYEAERRMPVRRESEGACGLRPGWGAGGSR